MSASSDSLYSGRRICKYGRSCYNKNPQHLEKFAHPWQEEDGSYQSAAKRPNVMAGRRPSGSSDTLRPSRTGLAPPHRDGLLLVTSPELGGALFPDPDFEYEGVLARWEIWVSDRMDRLARRLCPFRRGWSGICPASCGCPHHCGRASRSETAPEPEPDKVGHEGGAPEDGSAAVRRRRRPPRHAKWEGLREDVPERYQRWEGIRERNPVLSMAFGLTKFRRKQPTRAERVHLFVLYGAVWYFAYAFTLRRRGRACRKSWIEACVPEDQGGLCTTNCANRSVLERTPAAFAKYEDLREATMPSVDLNSLACIQEGAVRSACEVAMCTEAATRSCLSDPKASDGICVCDSNEDRVVLESIIYSLLFKIIYMPYLYIFWTDLPNSRITRCLPDKYRHVPDYMIQCTTVGIYVGLFAIGLFTMEVYFNNLAGILWESLWWFWTFLVLCTIEVFKAFFLGYILGSYVLSPLCCPCFSRIWKFMFS